MASGRQILKGIARYAREHGPWTMYHEPGHMQDLLPEWLRHWRGEGIIARVRTGEIADALASAGIPIVDVLDDCPHPRIHAVRVDNGAIARLAVRHFVDRGFRHFGYCGIHGPRWSRLRGDAMVECVSAAGHRCDVYQLPKRESPAWYAEAQRERLAHWIKSLPKPSGIMACNDLAGQRVLDACRRAGVAVPETVAVLGVDNDESLCEVSDPMLSSIVPAYDQIGYRAASVLDQLMQAATPAGLELLVQPTDVVVRRSSDILAIEDADLAAAVRFIRDHACEGIGVKDVVCQVALSYSTLKRRFQRVFQRSVHDEIVRIRLQRVRELLVGTELTLAAIARKTGFEHQEYLGAVFKAHLGVTPQQFRRDQQPGAQSS